MNPGSLKSPARVYLHEYGLREQFGGDGRSAGLVILSAFAYGEWAVRTLLRSEENLQYSIGIVWGDIDNDQKACDLFGYSGIEEWPGNPDVPLWVFRNGVLVKDLESCGDSLILLGLEEQHRRKCKNLEEYLEKNPKLPEKLFVEL